MMLRMMLGGGDGGGGVVIPLPGGVAETQANNAATFTRLTFFSSGIVASQHEVGTAMQVDHRWHHGAGGVGSVRATLTGGENPSSGTLGAWLPLTADRAWENASMPGGLRSSTLLLEISLDGGATVVSSGSYEVVSDSRPWV